MGWGSGGELLDIGNVTPDPDHILKQGSVSYILATPQTLEGRELVAPGD